MNGYKLLLVSAVGQRDGMALELATDAGEQVAEVFEDDATRIRTVTFYTDGPVPLPVVDWFLSEAANRL
jgi:hypothetical protein